MRAQPDRRPEVVDDSALATIETGAVLLFAVRKDVPITYDPAKNARNVRERGVPFDLAGRLIWGEALIGLSKRQEITATRFVALGEIDGRLHVVVFTIEGRDTRVISLRHANAREIKRWQKLRTPR